LGVLGGPGKNYSRGEPGEQGRRPGKFRTKKCCRPWTEWGRDNQGKVRRAILQPHSDTFGRPITVMWDLEKGLEKKESRRAGKTKKMGRVAAPRKHDFLHRAGRRHSSSGARGYALFGGEAPQGRKRKIKGVAKGSATDFFLQRPINSGRRSQGLEKGRWPPDPSGQAKGLAEKSL